VQRHFPTVPRRAVRLKTDQLDICNGEMAEITPESWEEVIGIISLIIVAESPIPPTLADEDTVSATKANSIYLKKQGALDEFCIQV